MNAASGMALPTPPAGRLGALRARWGALGERDRRMIGLAAVVLGAFLLWSVALQPAWRTLRDAPAQRDALDAQLQAMQALAAEVKQLRDAPALSAEQAAAALRASSDRLGGKARLTLQGDRAVFTFNGVSSTQLREWLAEVRAGARARPIGAQLSRGAQGFNGSVVLQIGAGR